MSTRINLWAADHGSSHEPGGSDISQTGLKDLIAGVTPTLIDWTNDPTDAVDITDGDISTFCTTGDKVITAGYQYAYFEWDLGAIYDVLCTSVGHIDRSAAVGVVGYLFFYDGTNWIRNDAPSVSTPTITQNRVGSGMCSKVRLGITAIGSGVTISPNIREFHVWRV